MFEESNTKRSDHPDKENVTDDAQATDVAVAHNDGYQSDNRRIAKNTFLLYLRMIIVILVGLYTSRVILQVLGVTDYGVYNAVGGVVTMFTVLSSSLSSAISRYLTFELGRGDQDRLNKVFSTSLNVQFLISAVILVLGITAGWWFVNFKMNIPHDRMDAANWVLYCSLISFAVGLISVPYNASIVSHERMSVYAYMSILEISLKLLIVFALYVNNPQRIYRIFYAWAFCALFAVFWCWKQKNIGWTEGERNWLFAQGHERQHFVNGIIRYFGTFTDAANFGIHMAAASVSFYIIAITNKVKKHRIFFIIAGVLCTWAMFQSGTRTAIFCMIAGFMVFLALSKSARIIVPISIVFGLFIGMLMFTNIGQGNNQIRRMRSAFNQKDASANVRDINKQSIAKYMKDAPWGIGIGVFAQDIPAWNRYKILAAIPPDSEYVFIWVRTGWIGVSWFTICNIIMLLGACYTVFFRIKNRSVMGIGAAWCSAFVAIHLGGYANQILMQFPNVLIFWGGLTTVYFLPKLEPEFEVYEAKELAIETEKKRLKLEKKLASRV